MPTPPPPPGPLFSAILRGARAPRRPSEACGPGGPPVESWAPFPKQTPRAAVPRAKVRRCCLGIRGTAAAGHAPESGIVRLRAGPAGACAAPALERHAPWPAPAASGRGARGGVFLGNSASPGGSQHTNDWAPLTRKRHIPPHSAQPQHTNDGAPRTPKRHQQEHRPQRPTESSDPMQHAKGRTGDRPGPRKGTTTRRNVTQGGGGVTPPTTHPPSPPSPPLLSDWTKFSSRPSANQNISLAPSAQIS